MADGAVTADAALIEAVEWLRRRLEYKRADIEGGAANAERLRAYADEVTTHLLTRDAALQAAARWEERRVHNEHEMTLIQRLLQEFDHVH